MKGKLSYGSKQMQISLPLTKATLEKSKADFLALVEMEQKDIRKRNTPSNKEIEQMFVAWAQTQKSLRPLLELMEGEETINSNRVHHVYVENFIPALPPEVFTPRKIRKYLSIADWSFTHALCTHERLSPRAVHATATKLWKTFERDYREPSHLHKSSKALSALVLLEDKYGVLIDKDTIMRALYEMGPGSVSATQEHRNLNVYGSPGFLSSTLVHLAQLQAVDKEVSEEIFKSILDSRAPYGREMEHGEDYTLVEFLSTVSDTSDYYARSLQYNPPPPVWEALIKNEKLILPPEDLKWYKTFRHPHSKALQVLFTRGTEQSEAFRSVADSEPDLALLVLGRLADRSHDLTKESLLPLLNSKDPRIRKSAIRVLGQATKRAY